MNNSEPPTIHKWNWMMDYCFSKRWAPSNSFYWQQADIAFNKHIG